MQGVGQGKAGLHPLGRDEGEASRPAFWSEPFPLCGGMVESYETMLYTITVPSQRDQPVVFNEFKRLSKPAT